ncbi:MAG TPA: DUF885 family protein [Gemmatimonadaceae bacterium]
MPVPPPPGPRRRSVAVTAALVTVMSSAAAAQAKPAPSGYPALVELFEEWRAFERPVMRDGVPDYTAAAITAKAAALPDWRARLDAIDTAGWPIAQQSDYKLVRAEMNGLDFDLRVLRPWARDPAFYVSVWASRTDVPSREAPVSHPEIQLYDYRFPLSASAQRELTTTIGMIPALLAQARTNLEGSNARDLWVYGERLLRRQATTLASLEKGTLTVSTLEGRQHADLTGATPALRTAITSARQSTEDFIAWLAQLAPTKTGPSGVGKENYAWYQRNVHFIPYSWDEEVVLLRRELDRAHAALRLEEHNNRDLPPLEPIEDPAAYDTMASARLETFVDFLIDEQIIPNKPYIKAALEPQLPRFVPRDRRAFFSHVTQREPMLLLSHDYHWIDLARMRDEPHPSPIRRVTSLSNIWDTRAEGFATAFEEILLHAGLYDDNPRARELVWIMLANRAARGLASLYVQANELTLEQAGHFHGEWTPRGWAKAGDDLTASEQLLYLRQPGYGTSYVTGKIQFDQLMTKYEHQQELAGKPFVLREFIGRFNDEGMIPIPLIEAELITKDTPLLP